MEKTRVKKGEKYWYVVNYCDGVAVESAYDNCLYSDKVLFESGNYFPDEKYAEAMAEKIRKVLKGADVIEMPSEEEYEKIIPQRIGCSDEFAAGEGNGYWRGYNYLKSKIVK